MPRVFFSRSPNGKWTYPTIDAMLRLGGKEATVEGAGARALCRALDEGADPLWAEAVMLRWLERKRPLGEKWGDFLVRLDYSVLERWGVEGTILGNLNVPDWRNLISREEAASASPEKLRALAAVMQGEAAAELGRRSEWGLMLAEVEKWPLFREPSQRVNEALRHAPPAVRERYAAATARYETWTRSATAAALLPPCAPPWELVAALHVFPPPPSSHGDAEPPPELMEAVRWVKLPLPEGTLPPPEGGISCCRAAALTEARLLFSESGATATARFPRGETAAGKYPPREGEWKPGGALRGGGLEWVSPSD